MKAVIYPFVVVFILFGSITITLSNSTKIAVIADIHFLSTQLASPGKALYAFENSTGRNLKDLHGVLDYVLEDLIKEEIDVLLIPGDITNHGALKSHLDFIIKLQPLLNSGIRVFVTPGNHDINIPNSKNYIGDTVRPVESITAKEFSELYDELGYGDAINKDVASLSYLAEINDDTWLLAIDANRYDEHTTTSITGGRIRETTMRWILDILEDAQKKDIMVLGMMHHGLVEHMPFQNAFFSEYLIEDWQIISDRLADAGLNIIFTGHFHANDITLRVSPNGNYIYDVETASLAQYPFAYRIMSLTDSNLSIDTRFVTEIPGNPKLEEEHRTKLEEITYRIAKSRLNNIGLPIPPHLKAVLIEMIVKLNMTHVRGDEIVDEEMIGIVESFAALLGNEVHPEEFTMDFPPEDNKLVIEFDSLSIIK